MKIESYIIGLLILFGLSEAQAQTVQARIDSVQMMIGEQTTLHLTATLKEGQRVQFPGPQNLNPKPATLEVVGTPSLDTVALSDGYLEVTQNLVLTAWDDSLYYIPAQKIKIDGKEYATKSLALKVLTVEVDTVHANQFYGPNDVQDNPFSWKEWSGLFWMAVAVALLYVACWLAYLRLKSKKPITFKVRIRKIIPPHQKALNIIEKVRNEKPEMADYTHQKMYYTQVTDALRQYMQERFGFNAMEMTSSEIVAELRNHGDTELQELTMLFETADLVKFAKYTAGVSENDKNLLSAIAFINETKQENVPTEERIEPTISEKEKQTMRMRISLKWAMGIMIIVIAALVAYLCWQLYDLRF